MGAEYCDDSVYLSVSLSMSACVSAASVPLERTIRVQSSPNLLRMLYGRGSVLL